MSIQTLAEKTHQAFYQSPFHLQVKVHTIHLPTPLDLAQGNDIAQVFGQVITLFRNNPLSEESILSTGSNIDFYIPHCISKMMPQYFVQGEFNILAEDIENAKYLEIVLDEHFNLTSGLIKPIDDSFESPLLAQKNWMFL